jgi:hypothetical protein
MGEIEDLQSGHQSTENLQLRSQLVRKLLYIIDELESLKLSPSEIDAIVRSCGLNEECAIRFGTAIRTEKAKEEAWRPLMVGAVLEGRDEEGYFSSIE